MRSSWPRSEWRLPSWVAHQLLEFGNLRAERMPTVGNFNLKFKWVIRSASMQADHLRSLGLWHWPATAWCIFLAVCVCACASMDAHFLGFIGIFWISPLCASLVPSWWSLGKLNCSCLLLNMTVKVQFQGNSSLVTCTHCDPPQILMKIF